MLEFGEGLWCRDGVRGALGIGLGRQDFEYGIMCARDGVEVKFDGLGDFVRLREEMRRLRRRSKRM